MYEESKTYMSQQIFKFHSICLQRKAGAGRSPSASTHLVFLLRASSFAVLEFRKSSVPPAPIALFNLVLVAHQHSFRTWRESLASAPSHPKPCRGSVFFPLQLELQHAKTFMVSCYTAVLEAILIKFISSWCTASLLGWEQTAVYQQSCGEGHRLWGSNTGGPLCLHVQEVSSSG